MDIPDAQQINVSDSTRLGLPVKWYWGIGTALVLLGAREYTLYEKVAKHEASIEILKNDSSNIKVSHAEMRRDVQHIKESLDRIDSRLERMAQDRGFSHVK